MYTYVQATDYLVPIIFRSTYENPPVLLVIRIYWYEFSTEPNHGKHQFVLPPINVYTWFRQKQP